MDSEVEFGRSVNVPLDGVLMRMGEWPRRRRVKAHRVFLHASAALFISHVAREGREVSDAPQSTYKAFGTV